MRLILDMDAGYLTQQVRAAERTKDKLLVGDICGIIFSECRDDISFTVKRNKASIRVYAHINTRRKDTGS